MGGAGPEASCRPRGVISKSLIVESNCQGKTNKRSGTGDLLAACNTRDRGLLTWRVLFHTQRDTHRVASRRREDDATFFF